MIISGLYILAFAACLAGIIWCPKSDRKMNGISMAVMGIMAIFCYQAFFALIFSKIGIPVNIQTAAAVTFAAAAVLWGYIIKKRRLQNVKFRLTDIFCLVLLAVFIGWLSLHMFTPELRLSYANSDPANHFKNAMSIVQKEKVGSLYFSAFIDAMFIELFAPFTTVTGYYKAFILADIFMHVLEIWMFYVLAITISNRKVCRFFAPVFAAGYFFGYPTYSYMTGGFVYWGIGVMILIFMIYALLLFERYPAQRLFSGALLLLGLYANSCCNKLFIPVNYAAMFVALFVLVCQMKAAGQISRKYFIIFMTVIAAGCLAAAVFFFSRWDSVAHMLEYVQVVGGIYRSMYVDLIFFVPAFIFVFYEAFFQRGRSKMLMVLSLCMVAITIAMYVLWYQYLMSTYYYYKIYYNLWLLGWLLAMMTLDIMAEKKQLPAFASYFGLVAGLAVITLMNYDVRTWNHNIDYNYGFVPKNVFYLYRYNADCLLTDYADYELSPQIMDVFAYGVGENETEKVVILSDNDIYKYWFNAMTVEKSYNVSQYELPRLLKIMNNQNVKRLLLCKDDNFYNEYKDYFELCPVIYENDAAVIVGCPGKNWLDVTSAGNYDKNKLKLYRYVKKNLTGERVVLFADKTAAADFIAYKKKTKQIMTDCYTWNFSARGNIDNLNNLGIRYIVLLYEDEYYQQNHYYFDSQETIYENEAGKVVRCIGDYWSTQYQ